MENILKNFKNQLLYQPQILNFKKNKKYKKVIICGMGGSHLAADILKSFDLDLEILVHKDYGLPKLNLKDYKNTLIICNSYSGNTEETISSFWSAQKLKLDIFIISSGGKLLELAKKFNIPYIEISEKNIPPRLSLGLQIIAILKAINKKNLINEIKKISFKINTNFLEKEGKNLANQLKNFIPLIYTSNKNEALAYNWKIKFNETSKIPAFYNVFPELNHNEMQGFDFNKYTKNLFKKFYVLFFFDEADNNEIKKRIKLTEKFYKNKKMNTKILKLNEKNIWLRIFDNLLLGDWTSYYLAKKYNNNPNEVLMIEKFKKELKSYS